MKTLGKIIVTALAVVIGAYILPGIHVEDSVITILIVAVVISLLNALVRPVLIVLTIPVTIFTLGLFLLVINAAIILLADWLVTGFTVDGFWWALLFSLILSVVNSIFNKQEARNQR
jgi:putative membrane protein